MTEIIEYIRSLVLKETNKRVQGKTEQEALELLEKEYGKGKVFTTDEMRNCPILSITGFLAPFVKVSHKKTEKKGAMRFTHYPRFYYDLKWD